MVWRKWFYAVKMYGSMIASMGNYNYCSVAKGYKTAVQLIQWHIMVGYGQLKFN